MPLFIVTFICLRQMEKISINVDFLLRIKLTNGPMKKKFFWMIYGNITCIADETVEKKSNNLAQTCNSERPLLPRGYYWMQPMGAEQGTLQKVLPIQRNGKTVEIIKIIKTPRAVKEPRGSFLKWSFHWHFSNYKQSLQIRFQFYGRMK